MPFAQESFFDLVYEVVKLVPPGRVTTYGAVARYLGSARSARMVGWAMNASNTHHEFIPAHRVVNRNGLLTGKSHFRDPEIMEKKLTEEGVVVKNDQVQNLKSVLWDPNIELNIDQ